MVPEQRGAFLKEDTVIYHVAGQATNSRDEDALGCLLHDIPLPESADVSIKT
jgi:hypothetical protein